MLKIKKQKYEKDVVMPLCAVPLCRAKTPPFHPFPQDDPQLFEIWKKCIFSPQFRLLTDEEIRKKYFVCDNHFADSCKISVTNTLKKYAIPTLNVQGFKDNSNVSIAYNLYIEKQNQELVDNSTITQDSNFKTNFIWVESNIESVNQDSSTLENIIDPLTTNSDNEEKVNCDLGTNLITNERMKTNSKCKVTNYSQTVSMINEKVNSVSKQALKKYSGPNKIIRKPLKSNQSSAKSHIKCSVPNCENRFGSFHKFPSDPQLCAAWKAVLGIKAPIKEHMKICSNHFKSSDYFVQFVYGPAKCGQDKFKSSRMNLKKNAIPFNSTTQKSQKKIFCTANNCYTNNLDHKEVRLLPFPKDERRAEVWAISAFREDLLLRPKFYENIYLCEKHFEKKYLRKNVKSEDIVPRIFDESDCPMKLDELYSNLFMETNIEVAQECNKSKSNPVAKNTLQIFKNDLDISKITHFPDDIVNESCVSSDFGKMHCCLYEDFVSNPGVLDLKPQKTDLLFKKNYCRLCAKLCSLAFLISIFDKSGNLTMYGKMIEICLPGKIEANDYLPQWMCSSCEYKLDVCCTSIKEFIEADNQLRKIFEKTNNESKTDVKAEDTNKIFADLKTLKENEARERIHLGGSPPNLPLEISNIIQVEENKKYQCLSCSQLYNSKKELIDHSLKAHNTTNIVCEVVDSAAKKSSTKKIKCSKLRYECVICSSLHEKKDSLIKHSLRYHASASGPGKRLVCRLVQATNLGTNHVTCLHCKEQFISIAKYRQHMRQHFKLNCNHCGMQFTRKYKLIAHAKSHGLKSCAKCLQSFADEMDLVKHQVSAHKRIEPEETKCSICDETFNTSSELVKHKKVHTKSLCNICGKLFSSSTLLKYHLERHTDERRHKCSLCPKSFQTGVSLRRHRAIHSGEKKCMCQVCGKQFGYLSALKSHMLSHSNQKPHVCDLCGAAFHRRNYLNKHLRTHQKIKDNSYKCKICQLEFDSKILCIKHKREEHATNEFTCDLCAKSFPTKFQMKIHRRIHTGETPYRCDQCDKSFRSSALAKQHRLIHMNVFPHQCNYCDRKFRRLQSLIVHRRTHTGEKPYPCPVCGKLFANRSDMTKHRRNLHHFVKNTTQQSNQNEADQQLDID